MKSDLPKVLHEVCGRPMLSYGLKACRSAGVNRLIIVVGHGREQIRRRFAGEADITWVEQEEQHGTGHAVLRCREALADFTGSVLVVAGDMPLLKSSTVADLLALRERDGDVLTLVTTTLDDPTGYGRIVRDEAGGLEAIIEHRDCSEEQLSIREVNPSYYCFDAQAMFDSLEQVKPGPVDGEIHLTETVGVLRAMGRPVSANVAVPPEDATGINSRRDLAVVNRLMEDRIQLALMDEGVTIVAPEATWIEADVSIGSDTTIYPFTFIGAGARIGKDCRVGPFAHVEGDETVEAGSCRSFSTYAEPIPK